MALIQIAIILCFVCAINGFCNIDKAIVDIQADGSVRHHCMYKGMRMEEGSKIKLPAPDCIECTCNAQGLGCCGYGIRAGVYGPPEGCKVIANGCTPVFVKIDDESKDCF